VDVAALPPVAPLEVALAPPLEVALAPALELAPLVPAVFVVETSLLAPSLVAADPPELDEPPDEPAAGSSTPSFALPPHACETSTKPTTISRQLPICVEK